MTGRTGSGCTTAANILCSEKEDIYLPSMHLSESPTNNERKNDIIFKYFENNWKPFFYIKISDIITSFLLENSFDELVKYISKNNILGISIEDFSLKEMAKIRTLYQDIYEITKYLFGGNRKYKKSPKSSEYKVYIEKTLPDFSNELKGMLDSKNPKLYIVIYQLVGNNIRNYGAAIPGTKESKGENIYKIVQRMHFLFKRLKSVTNGRFVFDALRNPFEVMYFQERYTSFYLFSINCDEADRNDRLVKNLNLNVDQINELDKQEDGRASFTSQEGFLFQNIPECFQRADVHILNQGSSNKNYQNELALQLVRYVCLILKPGIITPTSDEQMMQIAYTAKANSGCISRQVGAVVVSAGGKIEGVGWNDVPSGHVSCLLRQASNLIQSRDTDAYSDYEKNDDMFKDSLKELYSHRTESLEGRNLSFCFREVQNKKDQTKNQVHTRALHAEENAFMQITKHGGQGVKGGTLYSTASPCELCSKKAMQLSLSRIVYIDPYPGIARDHILKSGTVTPEISQFQGSIGKAFQKLYTPFLPYKDELKAIRL